VVLYLSVMTHIEGRKHDAMLSEKGGRGFPYLVWMNESGDVLSPQGDRSVKGFQATHDKLSLYMELRKRVADGDTSAEIDLAMMECELAIIDFGELEEKLEGKELTDAQKAKLEVLEVDGTLDEMLKVLNAGGRGNQQALQSAGKELLALHRKGRQPSDNQKQLVFFNILYHYSQAVKDWNLAEEALTEMGKRLPQENQRAQTWLETQLKRVAELKAEPSGEEETDEGIEESDG
jgi:hypothetical protein